MAISASEPLDCPVFIEEENEVMQIEFYPNPSRGIIYINGIEPSGNASLLIRDITGKMVHQVSSFKSESLDVRFLKAGYYYLTLEVGYESETEILIIK